MRLMAAQEQSCLSTKPSPCPLHEAEGCECPEAGPPGFRGREVRGRWMQPPEAGTAAPRSAQAAPRERSAAGTRLQAHASPALSRTPDRDDKLLPPFGDENYPQFKPRRGVGRGSSARLFADGGVNGEPKRPSKSGVGGGVEVERDGGTRRNKAAASRGAPLPGARGPLLAVPRVCRARGRRPRPDSSEGPSSGEHNPEASEVPGQEQKMGRPSPTRRPTPTLRRAPRSPASGSGTRARGRVSLATQSRGSAAPFIRAGAGAPRGREVWGRGGPRPGSGPRRKRASPRELRRPRAPVRAAPAGTAGKPLFSPYPPATGVGAPRSAGAPRGHGQLRAVETGVDSEEDRAELQPRGHGRALAHPGRSLRPGRPPRASPEWAVAPAAAAAEWVVPPSMRRRPVLRPFSLGPAPQPELRCSGPAPPVWPSFLAPPLPLSHTPMVTPQVTSKKLAAAVFPPST